MEYLFGMGFLGTKAPFFIDIILLIMAALPIILILSIFLAIKGYYQTHRLLQSLLFLVTLSALLMLQYEIHIHNDFDTLVAQSSFNPNAAFYYYVLYTVFVSVTMILWYSTLAFAKADRKRRALPGLYSSAHKQRGRWTSVFIILMALSNVGIYWVFFGAL